MSEGVRFIVGARAGRKGASWPFCYVRISEGELLIGGWPIPWFGPCRIAREDIGAIQAGTLVGAPVMRICDRDGRPTGDGIVPVINYGRVIDAFRAFGYQVDVT